MPEQYDFAFGQPGKVRGAVRVRFEDDHVAYWMCVDLGVDGFVVVRHDDVPLPRGPLLELRADGLWAELVCEVPGEHWAFALEGFGLQMADREEARTAERGERLPVGFDLEWDGGRVVGEVLVGRRRIAIDGEGGFHHTSDAGAADEWSDWL